MNCEGLYGTYKKSHLKHIDLVPVMCVIYAVQIANILPFSNLVAHK